MMLYQTKRGSVQKMAQMTLQVLLGERVITLMWMGKGLNQVVFIDL